MQEDSNAIYMLPGQYPVATSQPSRSDPRRRSYPRHYLTGTGPTNEQVQQPNNALGPHAPNLAVPSNAGYPMFDGQSTSLFQQRYAQLLILDDFLKISHLEVLVFLKPLLSPLLAVKVGRQALWQHTSAPQVCQTISLFNPLRLFQPLLKHGRLRRQGCLTMRVYLASPP
jgi:hypothetical protein